MILLWAAGACPYEYLVVKNIFLTGDLTGTLSSAVFGIGARSFVLNTTVTAKVIFENVIFILMNFPTPNIALIFVGLFALKKYAPDRPFAVILIALLILHFAFAFRYTVPDRHVFFLPFYCLAAALAGLGADTVLKRFNKRILKFAILAFALLPILIYFITPAVARRFYKPLAQRRQRPYRDEYNYWLRPWKTGYRGAERFAQEALDVAEKNAVVYAFSTDVHCLLYIQQVYGRRADVKIVSDLDSSEDAPALSKDTVADLMNRSPLYVAAPHRDYCPRFLIENYSFVKTGVLWRVVEIK